MRFDAVLSETQAEVPDQAVALEAQGYGGLAATELTHDPFVTALLALRATTRVQVGTQIAVAFARSPMTVAATARDLADLSGGRFVLGLGTQVEAHVTRRFSMPWSPPAARMREFVAALRAIWASWETGDRLAFRGEHYRHTLMTPAFSPGPATSGLPPVHLAAVGPKLAQTAGAVADGVVAHVFSTRRFVQQSLLPAVTRGLDEAGRDRGGFTVTVPVFVISGATPQQRAAADVRVRERIAFYGSTPAYRGVLEAEGRGDVADALHALSVSRDPDRWSAMGRLIDDPLVEAFAIVEDDPAAVPERIRRRYEGLADRVVVEPPEGVDPVSWSAAIAAASAG